MIQNTKTDAYEVSPSSMEAFFSLVEPKGRLGRARALLEALPFFICDGGGITLSLGGASEMQSTNKLTILLLRIHIAAASQTQRYCLPAFIVRLVAIVHAEFRSVVTKGWL